MKYPKEYLDEIKTRLKVSTVVSKSVSLKKRGKEYVGLSPFKNEKTPSFTVNDEKEFYHCFATSEHGNIFDFVMKIQNLKFGEAVKHLAQLAGMQPYMFSKQDEEREKKWKEYLDEIKTRLKVSTVVSKTVALKKRGKEFVGLSPFKNEKTPSFTVNDEKEFYHCFATSEHGNIFDFVMKIQNLKFGEAVKHLAQLAGMQPYMFSKQDEEREKKWKE